MLETRGQFITHERKWQCRFRKRKVYQTHDNCLQTAFQSAETVDMSHFKDRLAAECNKNAANYDFYLESIDGIRSKIKLIRYEDLALDFSSNAKESFFCRLSLVQIQY